MSSPQPPSSRCTETSQADADKLTAQWLALLDKLCELRAQEAGDNVHYYGLIQPNASRAQAIVVGLASNPSRENPGSIEASCAAGVSYSGDDVFTSDTLYHELGHAHSQSHSPGCDAASADPDYAYGSGGDIGVWGWDARDNSLKDPSRYKDFLSYCTPYWVSDYVFNKLVTPVQKIASMAAPTLPRQKTLMQTVFVLEDGRDPVPDLLRVVGLKPVESRG